MTEPREHHIEVRATQATRVDVGRKAKRLLRRGDRLVWTRFAAGVIVIAAGIAWMLLGTNDAPPAVLLGAGIVLVVDGLTVARDDRARRMRDLDETRRVLYMALCAKAGAYPAGPETAGTVVNALAHHYGLLTAADAESLGQRIVSDSAGTREHMAALHDAIDQITEWRDDPAPPSPA